ncbi:MAG: CdaR family protein [Chloroflexi bacterium OHK40]
MSNFRAALLRALLAMGLSFSLWAFVSFSQNPEETVTFPDVPLEAVDLAEGLVIVDQNGLPDPVLPTVDITLSTDRLQLANLRQVDIRAVVDLSGLGPGEHIVPVNVQPTRSNVSFNVPEGGFEPSSVPIRLEQLATRMVPIEVEVLGNLPFSFERGETRVTLNGQPVETVAVSGPQSRVERVEVARATANIEQLRATYLAPLTLTPLGAGGATIDGVQLDPTTVTVQIPINPVVGLKLVPVQPVVVGLPAAGYEVTGVTVEPPLIALTGSSGPLDAVVALSTEPIGISGANRTITGVLGIVFPEDTAPQVGEPDEVRVTVAVAPIARPFVAELPASVALSGVGAGLQATVNPVVVTVRLAGAGAALNALSQDSLRASVDATGLGPGVYQLTPVFALPEGVRLDGEAPVVQVVLRFPPTVVVATPTAEPEETATPEPQEPTATDTPEPPAATPEPPAATPEPPAATPDPVTPTP